MTIERIMDPDGLPDDRITCRSCTTMNRGGYCTFFKAQTMPDLPRRCVHFIPLKHLPDQRPGAVRWPGILDYIEEIRQMDREHQERQSREHQERQRGR